MEKLAEILKEKLSQYTREELEKRWNYYDKLYNYGPTIEDNTNDQCEPMIELSKVVEWMENNLPSELNYLTGTVELSSLIKIFKSDMISEYSDNCHKALEEIEDNTNDQCEPILNVGSDETLAEKYKRLGVDSTKFTPTGEMNILIQAFHIGNDEKNYVKWETYSPRKNRLYDGESNLNNPEEKAEYLRECENAIERFKMYAHLIQDHKEAIERGDSEIPFVYYPEL